jgi:hypothetical protein
MELYVFKKFWCQLLEDGETIAPKHVGSMQNIVNINYKIVHVCVLQELFTSVRKLNHPRIHKVVLKVRSIYLKYFEFFPSLLFPLLLTDSFRVWGDFAYLKFVERIPLLIPRSIYFRSSPFLLLILRPLTFLHPFCPTVCHSLWSSLTVISPRSFTTNFDISFSHFKFIPSIVSPKIVPGFSLIIFAFRHCLIYSGN